MMALAPRFLSHLVLASSLTRHRHSITTHLMTLSFSLGWLWLARNGAMQLRPPSFLVGVRGAK